MISLKLTDLTVKKLNAIGEKYPHILVFWFNPHTNYRMSACLEPRYEAEYVGNGEWYEPRGTRGVIPTDFVLGSIRSTIADTLFPDIIIVNAYSDRLYALESQRGKGCVAKENAIFSNDGFWVDLDVDKHRTSQLRAHKSRAPRRKSHKDMVGATINRNIRKMF